MVCRSKWDDIAYKLSNHRTETYLLLDTKQIEFDRLKAVLVVDDTKGCGEDSSKNCFRPSLPYPEM